MAKFEGGVIFSAASGALYTVIEKVEFGGAFRAERFQGIGGEFFLTSRACGEEEILDDSIHKKRYRVKFWGDNPDDIGDWRSASGQISQK